MRFETTDDALSHVYSFHNQLSSFYRKASKANTPGKVKLLLEYMAEKEKNHAKSIKNYKEQLPPKILEAWFQYTNDANVLKVSVFEGSSLILELDNAVSLALKYSDELIELYTDMSNSSHTKDLKNIFDNLTEMEQQERHNFSMSVDRLTDL